MALNPQSLLAQLSPARGLDLSGLAPSPGESMARQQLKLARERFAFEKKKQEEDAELERLRLKGEAARQAAAAEKDRLDREEQQRAALLEKQQGAMQKFGELAGSGKVEQAQAMVPYLDQLGYSVTDLGGVGGLPVFELKNRAEEAARAQQQVDAEGAAWERGPRALDNWDGEGGGESAQMSLARMGDMGLSGERGAIEPPGGIGSSSETDPSGRSVADRVAATYGTPGAKLATRGPDEADFTGGVQRNVIDLPAQQQATLARLNPMLGAIQESYPDAYRPSAGNTGDAVMQSGLPLPESLDLFKSLRQSPDELIKAGIQADAQKEQFKEKQNVFTPKDIEEFKKVGWHEADTVATKQKIPDAAAGVQLADKIDELLDDQTGANDTMIAADLMNMQVVKGTPSDRDLEAAFGTGKMSFIDQLFGYIESAAKGGFSTAQREAIKSYVKRTRQDLKNRVYQFLDSAKNPGESYNEHVKAGFADRARMLVGDAGLLGEYDDDRSKKQKGDAKARAGAELLGSGRSASAGDRFDPNPVSGDFDIELEGQALENDLDPDKLRAIMGPESGGKANARNAASGATGLIQFLPSVAEGLGTSTEALSKMSATEQLPYVMKYFSDRGITSDSPAEDYAMAVAAPNFIGKPPETVVYPKGSKAWEQNPAWRPSDGGDITVGSIQAFYDRGSGKAKAAEAPKAELPEPTTPAEKRIRELMERNR